MKRYRTEPPLGDPLQIRDKLFVANVFPKIFESDYADMIVRRREGGGKFLRLTARKIDETAITGETIELREMIKALDLRHFTNGFLVSGRIIHESCGYVEPWYQDALAVRLLVADERHLQPSGFVPGVLRFIDKDYLEEAVIHEKLQNKNLA